MHTKQHLIARTGLQWWVIGFCVAGMLATVLLSLGARRCEWKRIETDFQRRAENRVASIKYALKIRLDDLGVLRALWRSPGEVGFDGFRQVAAQLMRGEASIRALEWIPRVSREQRAQVELAARQWPIGETAISKVYGQFQITERDAAGQVIRAAEREEYFPVYYVEPCGGNEVAISFDLASEKLRCEAIQRARMTGEMVATPPIRLVQEKNHQNGFLVFLPVCDSAVAVDTNRAAALRGFVLGVFRAGDLVESCLQRLDSIRMDVAIFDSTMPGAEKHLYTHWSGSDRTNLSAPLALADWRGGLYREVQLAVADRQWTMMLRATPDFIAAHKSWVPAGVLLVGLLLTGILTGYLATMVRRARHVALLVQARTQQLAELNRSLQREIVRRKAVEAELQAEHARLEDQVAVRTRELEESRAAALAMMQDAVKAGEQLREANANLLREVAERKQTEHALWQIEERFRALVEKASDCFMVLTSDAAITYVSPSIGNVLGYTPEEKMGQKITADVHPEDRVEVMKVLEQLLREPGSAQTATIRLQHKQGDWRTVTGVATNLLDNPTVQGIVVNFRDITERLQLEKQFQQAQKMETLGQLAGGVAHDFNNCLQSILGYTDLLVAQANRDVSHLADLTEIKRAAQQASGITRQLLTFSRRQTFEMRLLDVNELAREQQKMLRRLIGEDISLELRLAPTLWPVMADAGLLQQVIMNLVVNARDAMPRGGRVTLSSANIAFTSDDITPGRFVQFSVTDTGVGMAEEIRQRLFEPFFTTKKEGHGTGLGLAVVHGIVKQHNGWVHVYSTPGKGSEFKIFLPSVAARETATVATESVVVVPRGVGQRILVVEDEAAVRLIAARNLRNHGYQIWEVASMAEARTAFRREKGAFELLFSDVVLPDGTGLELTTELLAQKPNLRVLLTSGYADDKARWPEIQRRGWRFLQKPYPNADLLRVLHEVLTVTT